MERKGDEGEGDKEKREREKRKVWKKQQEGYTINAMKTRKIERIKENLPKGERQKRAKIRERNGRLKKGVAAIEEGGGGRLGG